MINYKTLEGILECLNRLNYIPGITPFKKSINSLSKDLDAYTKGALKETATNFDGAGFLNFSQDRFWTAHLILQYLKNFGIIAIKNDKIEIKEIIKACKTIDQFSYLILISYYKKIYKNSVPKTRKEIINSINKILKLSEAEKKMLVSIEIKIDKLISEDFDISQMLSKKEFELYSKTVNLWNGKIWFATPLIRVSNPILKNIKQSLTKEKIGKLNNDSLSQHNMLIKIFNSLKPLMINRNIKNEETLKNIFFSKIFPTATKLGYHVHREEYLKKHIGHNGEADFYLQFESNKKSNIYSKEIAIEFKFNCLNEMLIKHDIEKLLKIRKINPKIAPVFINFFTKAIDFNKYKKIITLFKKHKIYEIAIGPEVYGFLYKSGREILEAKLKSPTLISSSARFQSHFFLRNNTKLIATPGFDTQRKFISLIYFQKTKKISIDFHQ